MVPAVARLNFTDLQVGQEVGFETSVSEADVDRFAELSGDVGPLHLDDGFARARGFDRRVVHGAYLTALVSQLVGVHLPGQNCLIHRISMQFRAPALTGTRLLVSGVVDQLSDAVQSAVVKVVISDMTAGSVVATGKVSLGFTRPDAAGPGSDR